MREDDSIRRTHPTARGTAFAAVVRLFNEDVLRTVDTIDPEQAEIDTFHAVGAATEIDDRIPASRCLFVHLNELATDDR